MTKTIHIKRAYDEYAKSDGYRVLVDRLWPRGLTKEQVHYDVWAKDLAPSAELREWFGHDPKRWEGFRKRYLAELDASGAKKHIAEIVHDAGETITLVYGAKDTEHNDAVVLEELFRKAAR
jgi:uncharacterized protein YeaO (DUF488 family)